MKPLLLLLLSIFTIISCEEETPSTPTNPPPSTTPTLIGNWGWQNTLLVLYDNGQIVSTNNMPYDPNTNIHNFNADGNMYAGNTIVGTHNGSDQVTITIGTPITFTVIDLTLTSMTLKQYPNGCSNCLAEERYYVK